MSRLEPINKRPQKQNVFHNMAFVIFCPKHRKTAFSDQFDEQRGLTVWFPFVYLSSNIEKRITIEESISLILSGDNPELMTLYKEEQPFESNVSYVLSEFKKQFKFGFTRSVCLVRLHSDNPVLQCCRKTSRIIWLDIEHILSNYFDCFWGIQIETYTRLFDEEIKRLRINYRIYTNMLGEIPLSVSGEEAINSLNITEKQIQLFYIDFIEHCFPTTVMSFFSFKAYFGKYGFKTSEKSMKRLFNGIMLYGPNNESRKGCISFKDLLLGLALIDPQSVFNNSRIAFIFRYYDINRDGYLSKEELREMIEDIHENETSDMIDSIVNDYWFVINPFEEGIDYNEFRESVHNQTIIVPDSFCRFENRILLKIISTLETRNEGIVSRIKTFVSHYCSQLFMKLKAH